MTVAELIKQLQTLPQDALVISEGYEDGYDALKKVSVKTVTRNPQQAWYLGDYVDAETTAGIQAVFLNADTKAGV